MSVSRRGFIGGSLALATLAACGKKDERGSEQEQTPTQPDRRAGQGNPPPTVAAVTSPLIDVRGHDPGNMVAAALTALGGIEKFVSKGAKVVIKPNAAFARPPEWAVTTHPETVAAVVKACVAAGAASVTLVERPGGRRTDCVERCGIAGAVANIPGVDIKVLTNRSDFTEVEVEDGIELEKVEVATAVLDADVYINIPAAKSHMATGVTLGMKNAMGVIWDRRVFHGSLDIHKAIADLARVVKPDLTILDATRALLTNGPAGPGDVVKPGRMIASRDMIAVDAYGLSIARFDHKQLSVTDVAHIAHAGASGLGQTDVARMKVIEIEA